MGTRMTANRLSLYDLTGIQPYIFGSNRLKENLGASFLASQALGEELCTILTQLQQSGACIAELHWEGGGNAMVATSENITLEVARRLSQALIEKAPGLQFACAHVPWSGREEDWAAAYTALVKALEQQKFSGSLEPSFDGGGVTEACQSTGEPACPSADNAQEEEGDPPILGPSAQAKLLVSKKANLRLARDFPLISGWGYTDEVEKLGGTRSEQSMVGVLHFDGNGMGQRFQEALQTGSPAEARARVTRLSTGVDDAGRTTLKNSLAWLNELLQQEHKLGLSVQRESPNGAWIFPVRPLVYGGDDITLICDARIALDLAARLLDDWHEATKKLPGGPATACVGVALVKMRYPFFRAYQLAEALCQNAKKAVRLHTSKGSPPVSALDWELHMGGPMLELTERRQRFSEVEAVVPGTTGRRRFALHSRPFLIAPGGAPLGRPDDWHWFRQKLVGVLQNPAQPFAQHKAQLHRLANALQQGPEPARAALETWRHVGLPQLPVPPGVISVPSGFIGDRTPYLDAIELMDLIVSWHLLSKEAP